MQFSIYHGSIVSTVLQLDLVHSGHFATVLAGAVFLKSRAKASLAAKHVTEPRHFAFRLVACDFLDIFMVQDFGYQP